MPHRERQASKPRLRRKRCIHSKAYARKWTLVSTKTNAAAGRTKLFCLYITPDAVPCELEKKKRKDNHQLMRASIDCLHRGPKILIARITELLATATRPRIVKIQPLPIASMIGAATMDPAHEKILRTKLLSATPAEDFFGMNSVSIVVTMPKMSIEPTPKKKFAIIYLWVSRILSW